MYYHITCFARVELLVQSHYVSTPTRMGLKGSTFLFTLQNLRRNICQQYEDRMLKQWLCSSSRRLRMHTLLLFLCFLMPCPLWMPKVPRTQEVRACQEVSGCQEFQGCQEVCICQKVGECQGVHLCQETHSCRETHGCP